ncbi:restriction endonuclease subunit S [Exiguobacterium sp. s57]|uniref:restriction endonuclease subunit S n=1 Tax=Exiguobacterium sp. s57 TaxID=2751258 RepID=UPI001BE97F61
MKNNMQPEIRFPSFSERWEQKKIGDFYTFKNGLNKEKEFFGSGTPIVNFTDVFHNRRIFFEQLKGKVQLSTKEIQNYNVKQGDIFFTRTSETINEIGLPSVMINDAIDTVFSGFVLRGRAIGEDPLTLDFKSYVFFTASFREEMKKKSSMTTRALTSGTAIKEMFFNFPENKEEQMKIGKFFKNLDDTISLHQQELEALKQTKQGFLQKMFPKKGESLPQLRFKEFDRPWSDCKLKNLGEIKTGATPSTGDIDNYSEEGMLWITPTDIKGMVTKNSAKKLSLKGQEKARIVEPYSILVTSIASIGKNTMVEGYASFNQQINSLTPFKSNDSYFLLTQSYFWSKEMKNKAASGTMQIVNKSEFSEMSFLVPEKKEQVKIGEFFRQLDEVIELKEKELEVLMETKKGFLQKMFV